MNNELIYLACPYTHPARNVMVSRFEAANKAAGKLMSNGKYVFSPISHTHPIADSASLPRGWDYWEGYDRRILSCCNRVIVLKLEGWEKSTGVQAEIKIALELNLPVEYVDPD